MCGLEELKCPCTALLGNSKEENACVGLYLVKPCHLDNNPYNRFIEINASPEVVCICRPFYKLLNRLVVSVGHLQRFLMCQAASPSCRGLCENKNLNLGVNNWNVKYSWKNDMVLSFYISHQVLLQLHIVMNVIYICTVRNWRQNSWIWHDLYMICIVPLQVYAYEVNRVQWKSWFQILFGNASFSIILLCMFGTSAPTGGDRCPRCWAHVGGAIKAVASYDTLSGMHILKMGTLKWSATHRSKTKLSRIWMILFIYICFTCEQDPVRIKSRAPLTNLIFLNTCKH